MDLVLEGRLDDPQCIDGKKGVSKPGIAHLQCGDTEDFTLVNGMHIVLKQAGHAGQKITNANPERVVEIGVSREKCRSDVINFEFISQSGKKQTLQEVVRFNDPGVNKEQLVKSQAYAEIVKFAESIKLSSTN